jgi:hypothetical protein
LRRILTLTLVATAGCDWAESPLAPTDVGTPNFSVNFSPGDLIGTTNGGELVRIDLSTGTVTLTGDAGVFDGRELGWTGLAFDASGNLLTSSRYTTESGTACVGPVAGVGPCSHLYRVDLETGSVIAEVGSVGVTWVSDLAFGDGTLFGNGFFDQDLLCCGALLTIDPATGQGVWVNDPDGFGTNPTDEQVPLQNGGLAIHPLTGELWGIENAWIGAGTMFRIDRMTGLADSIMRLGLDGIPTEFGFDGLAILPDGTFLTTRGGGGVPPTERLYSVNPIPDAESGFAELALIPLSYATPLQGHINGLEVVPAPADTAEVVLTLKADTAELHPWIQVTGRVGDTTTVSLTVQDGEVPQDETVIEFRAEFLPSTGGHTHLQAPLDFEDSPTRAYGGPAPQQQQPVLGYFKQGQSRTATYADTTDANGEIRFAFVAGWVGGTVDLIASTSVDSERLADTLSLTIKVPGLMALQNNPAALTNALFVGGTAHHPQFVNWHVTAAFGNALTAFTEAMHGVEGDVYIQVNDASLEYGGAFSVDPPVGATAVRMDSPFRRHNSHAVGVDADIALCWSSTSGATASQTGRVSPSEDPENVFTCPEGKTIDQAILTETAEARGLLIIPEDNHYHVRHAGN